MSEEVEPKDNLVDGKTIGEISQLDQSERTMRQRVAMFIYERQGNADMHRKPDSSISQMMDRIKLGLREEIAQLYDQEIAEIAALDPGTITWDDVSAIAHRYQQQRDSLVQAALPNTNP